MEARRATVPQSDPAIMRRTATKAALLDAVYAACPGLSRAQARDIFEMALEEISYAPGPRRKRPSFALSASSPFAANASGSGETLVLASRRRSNRAACLPSSPRLSFRLASMAWSRRTRKRVNRRIFQA